MDDKDPTGPIRRVERDWYLSCLIVAGAIRQIVCGLNQAQGRIGKGI
jgi:hypothetical protein